MRKVIGLLLVLCMGVCLVACESSNKDASKDPNYKQQKVTCKDKYEITCINDEVVCDKKSVLKPDVLVTTFEVKNIGKKEEKLASFAKISASQAGKRIYLTYLKDKNGKSYSYYVNQSIKPGKTAIIKYDWKLANHKDDVIAKFSPYTQGAKAGEMTFKVKGRQTKANKKYEEESKKEYESRAKIKKGDFKSCKVTVPKGWVTRNLSTYSISISKDKLKEGPSKIISISAFDIKTDSAKTEAKKSLANFGTKKTKVKEYTVDGKKCYGFEPVDNQFYIYAKSSDGSRIEIHGMGISFENAKDILNKNVTIK